MPISDFILGSHGVGVGVGGGSQSLGNGVVFEKDNWTQIEEGQINNTEKLRLNSRLGLLSELKKLKLEI